MTPKLTCIGRGSLVSLSCRELPPKIWYSNGRGPTCSWRWWVGVFSFLRHPHQCKLSLPLLHCTLFFSLYFWLHSYSNTKVLNLPLRYVYLYLLSRYSHYFVSFHLDSLRLVMWCRPLIIALKGRCIQSNSLKYFHCNEVLFMDLWICEYSAALQGCAGYSC